MDIPKYLISPILLRNSFWAANFSLYLTEKIEATGIE